MIFWLSYEFDRSIHQNWILYWKVEIWAFSEIFAGDEAIFIPNYFVEYTQTLVMELVEGIKAKKSNNWSGWYRSSSIAQRGVEASFRQVFEFGFFHADLIR